MLISNNDKSDITGTALNLEIWGDNVLESEEDDLREDPNKTHPNEMSNKKKSLMNSPSNATLPPVPVYSSTGATPPRFHERVLRSNLNGDRQNNMRTLPEKKLRSMQIGATISAVPSEKHLLILPKTNNAKFFKFRKLSHSK